MQKYNKQNIPLEIDGIPVVQDTTEACLALMEGKQVARYEFGDSMKPLLSSGQFCKLIPLASNEEANIGDIVFALVSGTPSTHMVWMKSREEDGTCNYLISTSRGGFLGWTKNIIAKAYGIPHIVENDPVDYNLIDYSLMF